MSLNILILEPNKVKLKKGDSRSHKRRADEGIEAESSRNYGAHVSGNWVFGMRWWNKDNSEFRMFLVDRRDRDTLEPLILRYNESKIRLKIKF